MGQERTLARCSWALSLVKNPPDITSAGRNPPLRCREAPSQLATNEKFNHANFAQIQANSSNVRSISRTILLTIDGSPRSLEEERQPSVRRRPVGTFARTARSRPQDRPRTGLTHRGRVSVGAGQ